MKKQAACKLPGFPVFWLYTQITQVICILPFFPTIPFMYKYFRMTFDHKLYYHKQHPVFVSFPGDTAEAMEQTDYCDMSQLDLSQLAVSMSLLSFVTSHGFLFPLIIFHRYSNLSTDMLSSLVSIKI